MTQRRRLARAAVTSTAATTILALAAPAWASSDIPLHTAHKGSTAAGFQQECNDNRFADRPADHDGWHFVLPGGPSAGGFEQLTLTFDNGDDTVTITVPDADDAYPDAFYAAGGRVIHAYLFTPAGWTLVDGSATISGTAERFNLSHTCAGSVPQSPSPSPSVSPSPSEPPSISEPPSESPSPSDSESPIPTDSPSASPSSGTDDGDLPITGAAVTSIALLGAGLVGGGIALLTIRRRRDRVTFTS